MQQLTLFSTQFGPYPFLNEKYGHARFTFGGGMEHQTISSMVNLSENLSAHELMHQWFGNAVTCASFEHIWFNEGFATFGELLWIEHIRGKQAGIDWRSNRIATAANVPNNAIVWPEQAVAYANPAHINNIFNFRVSYVKAAIVVNMLRYVLGETAFNRAVTKMVQEEFSGKSITTAQFQQFMERKRERSYPGFFSNG
jgi:aminopeptidase N